MKIGIIGNGVLGRTHSKWLLANTDHEVLTFSLDGKCNSDITSLIQHSEIVFICVPTPEKNGRIDVSIVDEVCAKIAKIRGRKDSAELAVVIRSTVPVGTTRKMAAKYVGAKKIGFFFIPEFLTEKTAELDFATNLRNVIGMSTRERTPLREKMIGVIASMFPRHPYSRWTAVTYEEAELLKLATNSIYATKVMIANGIKAYCDKLGISYEVVRDIFTEDPRIGSRMDDNAGQDVHFRVAQDGRPGYGGKCLPKDTKELAAEMREAKVGFDIFGYVSDANDRIRNGEPEIKKDNLKKK